MTHHELGVAQRGGHVSHGLDTLALQGQAEHVLCGQDFVFEPHAWVTSQLAVQRELQVGLDDLQAQRGAMELDAEADGAGRRGGEPGATPRLRGPPVR